jgi:hypothetical protein
MPAPVFFSPEELARRRAPSPSAQGEAMKKTSLVALLLGDAIAKTIRNNRDEKSLGDSARRSGKTSSEFRVNSR